MIRSDLTNEALLGKLRQNLRLEAWEEALVAALPAHDAVMVRDQPVMLDADTVFLVLDGWLCGYQMAGDGERQIKSFHLTGDIPNVSRLILPGYASQYTALSPCHLALFRASALKEVCQKSVAITGYVSRLLAIEARIAQEWIVNLAGRKSVARAAHLLCELAVRLDAAVPKQASSPGQAPNSGYVIPLTQTDLGDALGLSTVHTNRVLQELRAQHLIAFAAGHLAIPDRERLAAVAGFDPAYLHLKASPVTA